MGSIQLFPHRKGAELSHQKCILTISLGHLTLRARHVVQAREKSASQTRINGSARRRMSTLGLPFTGRLRGLPPACPLFSEGAKSRSPSIKLAQTCEDVRKVESGGEEGKAVDRDSARRILPSHLRR